MKVIELEGGELDLWVLRALQVSAGRGHATWARNTEAAPPYSSCWNYGGPIIERERITPIPNGGGSWEAMKDAYPDDLYMTIEGDHKQAGRALLVAAMRCYVASKFGDEVPESGI